MKEKIKNVIKNAEIVFDIHYIEGVLLEHKNKDDIKKYIRYKFNNLINECTISYDGDYIDYVLDGRMIFYYNKKSNEFGVTLKPWDILINWSTLDSIGSTYRLCYQGLSELLIEFVDEILHYKNVKVIKLASGNRKQPCKIGKCYICGIKKLIEENGFDKVEIAINDFKHKIKIEKRVKNEFLNLIKSSLKTKKNNGDKIYKKNDKWIFYYEKISDFFYVKYDIWNDLEKKYNLNLYELSGIINKILLDEKYNEDITVWPGNFV